MGKFSWAQELSKRRHINPHRADLLLHPPESYFFVQDFLILSCAMLYVLCYFFYTTRTFSDQYCAGIPLYLAGNLAYELYYALVMPRSRLEQIGFFAWFACDVLFVAVVLWRGQGVGQRRKLAVKLVAVMLAGMALLKACGSYWLDDMETVVAFWSGIMLELPVGWGSIYLLLKRKDTRGQSLEIWVTRFLGCIAAFAVFGWRYVNAPQNWAYVGSFWSLALMVQNGEGDEKV